MSSPSAASPHNRLGLNYRRVPPRRLSIPIVDAHTHVRECASTGAFFEAAAAYGVSRVLSMSPVEHVERLQEQFGERIGFIAVPRWRDFGLSEAFRDKWMADLGAFRAAGAQLCKFWVAPPMREKHGLTLDHPFLAPVIRHALELGYQFLLHVGDPSVWWRPAGKYANTAVFGTKPQQYEPLEHFLNVTRDRLVILAHMGGSIEEPEFLQSLLDRHPRLHLDCSATKWIVRETARQPAAARAFVIRNADRILFGSDVVVDEKYDFDHYASRYWCHQMMWESSYRGESPIEDPDAELPPRLAGLDLPDDVLRKMSGENVARLGL
ncbi:Amidohydrolase [Phycisphaerae bacterium RAS1]|nr:Amidohydrolase [Phycisphaerae bacterium RAS1]